jgi:hypothetical protein
LVNPASGLQGIVALLSSELATPAGKTIKNQRVKKYF